MTVGEAGNGTSVSPDELSPRLVACLEQGDLDGLAALYTGDALLLPPGRPGMAGRQPVAAFWRELAGRIDQVQAETTGIRQLGRDDLLETGIPLGDLPEDARAWERGVAELAEEDEDVAEYVRNLEESQDAADLPEASGEAIAREFERYLKRRDTD